MSGIGRLIVVEGLDGSGKSTFVRALSGALGAVAMGTPDGCLRPARSVLDGEYRGHPVAGQLFYASSVVHASGVARGHVAEGRDVVMDRYWASTVVYAQLRPACVDLASVEAELLRPDVTFWLDVPEEVRLSRLSGRAAGGEALTRADLETLAPARAAELRALYRTTLSGPLHGRIVETSGDVAAALLAVQTGATTDPGREGPLTGCPVRPP